MNFNLTPLIIDVFDIDSNINIFITELINESQLLDDWKKIRNYIALKYQKDADDDFGRWNFYLFYVVNNKNSIDKALKYQIEHDTVSSRKIIVNQDEVTNDGKSLIQKYIKYSIDTVRKENSINEFVKDENIKDILKLYEN